MKKIGIDQSTFKSGKFKDIGSPFRKTTPEDQAYLNELISDVYGQFVGVVVKERKLKESFVKKYADGRVFTGKMAYELGFVDTLGTFEDAVKIAASMGGMSGRQRTVRETKRVPMMERLLGETASKLAGVKEEFLDQPVLQYKYQPY